MTHKPFSQVNCGRPAGVLEPHFLTAFWKHLKRAAEIKRSNVRSNTLRLSLTYPEKRGAREKVVGNGLVKEGQGPERAGFVLRAGPLGERALRAGPQNGSSLEGRAAGGKGEGLGGGAVRSSKEGAYLRAEHNHRTHL